MLQNLKKRQEGFTIIEVMIVLVIAAVILLIVFLAVPALQRNSRNTQRKNEAAQLLAAAGEFSSNKNGTAPTNADSTTIVGLTQNKNITTITVDTGAPSLTAAVLWNNSKCNAGATAHTTGAQRQIALEYQVENGAGNGQTVCTSSGL